MISHIGFVERASFQQMSPERREIVSAYRFDKYFRHLFRRRLRSSFDQKRITALEPISRLGAADCRMLHAGQRFEAVFQRSQENNALLVFLISLSAKAHLRR